MNAPVVLTSKDVSRILRVEPPTLRRWRARDYGPRSFKVGRLNAYDEAEVLAWLRAQQAATSRGEVAAS